jgi:hypothetical protein
MRPSYIALCLIALAAGVVSSCCGRTEEPKAQAAGPSPASVVVQKIAAQDVPAVYEYVGQIAGSPEKQGLRGRGQVGRWPDLRASRQGALLGQRVERLGWCS